MNFPILKYGSKISTVLAGAGRAAAPRGKGFQLLMGREAKIGDPRADPGNWGGMMGGGDEEIDKASRESTKKHCEWLIGVLVVIATASLDPFGLGTVLERRSREVAVRALAPFYEADARDQVAVVLADDDYLEKLGEPYPFSRAYFASIFSEVLKGEPAGVFLDFHLPPGRDPLGSEILADYVKNKFSNAGGPAGAPVIFAADIASTGAAPDDYSLGGAVPLSPVRSVDDGLAAYPMCIDGAARAQPCAQSGVDAGALRRSPAASMVFALHCGGDKPRPACAHISRMDAMVLRWPRRPAQSATADGAACERTPRGFPGKLALAASIFWSGVSNDDFYAADQIQPCTPFLTVSAADLDTMSEAALREAFQGRAVFIGSHFDDAPDRLMSPVHGQLPGVFGHAAAYENLAGARSSLWRNSVRGSIAPWGAAFNFLATLLFGWIGVRSALTLSQEMKESTLINRVGLAGIVLAAVLFVAVAFGLILPTLFKLAPSSFYGHLTVALSVAFAMLVEANSIWITKTALKVWRSLVGIFRAGARKPLPPAAPAPADAEG
ncbi:MAG TPA: hypothetical protein DDZ68_17150 [Parvularcula sp.]|nr:hypothetical protein [Parvularcula sp.]